MSPEICTCGRPLWTKDDLARWNREIVEFGGSRQTFNPDWAKPICWCGRNSGKCPMKPLTKEPTP